MIVENEKYDEKRQKKLIKNDKLEHVLLYHFLNDENSIRIMSPRKKSFFLIFLN